MKLIITINKLTLDIEKGGYHQNQPPLTCWVSGYFRHKSTKILFNDKAAEYAAKLYSNNQLIDEACHLNGSFTLIICDEINKIIFVITDRYGSVPIYYGQKGSQIYISDTYWRLVEDIGAHKLNKIAISQLIQFCYVLGTQTIIEGVSEFAPHAITKIQYSEEPYLSKKDYWLFSYTEQMSSKEPELLDRLTHLFDNIFDIYCRVIKQNEWSAAIPLSGGIDSRLITWSFKKNNVPAVTYSYGARGDFELEMECQVEEALDIPMKKIIWTNHQPFVGKPHHVLAEAIGFTTRYSLGVGAYAIGEECNLAYKVVLPGHVDIITGHHLKNYCLYLRNWENACKVIKQSQQAMSDNNLRRIFPWAAIHWRDIEDSFRETTRINNDPTLTSLTQRWEIEQRQRRLILRECEAYKLFGFRILMPFCDYEIIDFFTSLPRRYLYHRYLYRKMMNERLYTGEYSLLGKINTTSGLISSYGEKANIPTNFEVAAKIPLSRINRIRKRVIDYFITPAAKDRYWYFWYHSPLLRQYFKELLRDSPQCQKLFDMKVINQFLRQATPAFISEPLYSLGTIAHKRFHNYE